MNRRHMIRGIAASALLPVVPAANAAPSLEERKREALRLMASLPGDAQHQVTCLSMCLRPGRPDHNYVRGLLESGVPVDECFERTTARVMKANRQLLRRT